MTIKEVQNSESRFAYMSLQWVHFWKNYECSLIHDFFFPEMFCQTFFNSLSSFELVRPDICIKSSYDKYNII